MPVKRATKAANICATIYEGAFDIDFNCVGETVCKYATCELMPPTGEHECFYREYGSCRSPHAKSTALESLRNRLTKELKQIEEATKE